jgi:hypothetical protein
MSDDTDSLRTRIEQLSTEELFAILRERDAEEWRPEALEIVAAALRGRGVSAAEIEALPPAGTDVIEDQPVASIARFFNPGEAHAFKMALAEAGIPAWVADQSVGTMYGIAIGVRLLVRTTDVAAAQEILDSAAASAAELPLSSPSRRARRAARATSPPRPGSPRTPKQQKKDGAGWARAGSGTTCAATATRPGQREIRYELPLSSASMRRRSASGKRGLGDS